MDHDQLSKTILTAFFGEFIELFQKALVQAIHVDTRHVSNFPENYFTIWKDGRMEASTPNLPSFHPSNHKECQEVSETCLHRGVSGKEWRGTLAAPKFANLQICKFANFNPLAFAFAAQMKRGDWSKGRLKYECLSRIVRCQVNEARRSLLINWVQTYLELSETEQQEFEALVTASPLTEEVRTMLLTYEGKMIQKGIQQGIQQAKQQTLLD